MPAQGRGLELPAEPGPGGGDRAALVRHLDADEVTFLVDRRLQMSLFSLMVDGLITWLDKRFTELALPSKLLPDEANLRAMALSAMKQALADWILDRFHEATRADFVVDQVLQALSDDLKADGLSKELQVRISAQPDQAWRAACKELMLKRAQAILEARGEEIERLTKAHVG